MKKFLLAAFVCLLSLNLSIGDAEAARLGGGRSFGMQRQAVTPRPAAPARGRRQRRLGLGLRRQHRVSPMDLRDLQGRGAGHGERRGGGGR